MTPGKITLIFPSLDRLWSFVREVKINYIEFSSADFSLVCNCNETDIKLAKEKYGARI